MKKRMIEIGISAFIALVLLVFLLIYRGKTDTTILGSLFGVAATFCVERIFNAATVKRAQFTGYYRDEIFSNNNPTEIIKQDKFELFEKDGSILSGDFMRYFPEESDMTHWRCSGFIVLDQLLLSYRADRDTIPSRGVILVKQDTTRTRGLLACYTGQYFKYEGDKIIAHKINLIKIDKREYDSLQSVEETTKST